MLKFFFLKNWTPSRGRGVRFTEHTEDFKTGWKRHYISFVSLSVPILNNVISCSESAAFVWTNIKFLLSRLIRMFTSLNFDLFIYFAFLQFRYKLKYLKNSFVSNVYKNICKDNSFKNILFHKTFRSISDELILKYSIIYGLNMLNIPRYIDDD